jgi:hypothetical protein
MEAVQSLTPVVAGSNPITMSKSAPVIDNAEDSTAPVSTADIPVPQEATDLVNKGTGAQLSAYFSTSPFSTNNCFLPCDNADSSKRYAIVDAIVDDRAVFPPAR